MKINDYESVTELQTNDNFIVETVGGTRKVSASLIDNTENTEAIAELTGRVDELIDDTSTATDKTWSASKISEEIDTLKGISIGFGSMINYGNVAQGNSVTVEKSGLIRGYLNPSTTTGAYARINLGQKGNFSNNAKAGDAVTITAPVSKGDTVTVAIVSGASALGLALYPFEVTI